MQRIFISACVTYLIFCSCVSQPAQPPFNDRAYVKERLKLADEQEHAYWLIMFNYDKKKQAIMAQYKPQMPQRPQGGERPQKPSSPPGQQEIKEKFQFLKNELEILNKETAENLQIVLTEEQIQEWRKLMDDQQKAEQQEIEKEMKEKMSPRGGPPGGFGGPR